MKMKKIYDDVLHFLIHHSIIFTVIIMCMVHASLLVLAWAGGAPELALTNVVSVIVYLFCIILCNFGHITPVYVSILLEVGVFSAISTHYIGWNTGGFFFLFAIVPIIIYFGCFIFKGVQRWIIAISLIAIFIEYVILYLICVDRVPVYDVGFGIKVVLMVFSSFVMFFGVIFYNGMHIYASEHEVISLEEKNEKLTEDAKIDALTGLLNRRGFMPIVEQTVKSKDVEKYCVAFGDIDNFKRINDSYGHECGDEVLMHIARLITKEMSECDVCRWGGEEIVILMKDLDIDEAREKMEHLRNSIEVTPTIFFNKVLYVTTTIGVAQNSEIYKEPEDVIKAADERMYYGKQHGKNIVVYEDH